jgi:SAM-dependent methyltransferase
VVVANYDFNANALALRRFFADAFPTLLIDGSSPQPLEGADLVVPNEGYRGLWNAAVQQALAGGHPWLFFLASDVQLVWAEGMKEIVAAICADERIALWTPSLARPSRHSYPSCTHRPGSILRVCGAAEGFCFLVRTEVVRPLHPVPASNRFGYGIDMATAVRARAHGEAVVDDRVLVFHPQSRPEHRIDEARADRLGKAYLQDCSLDPAVLQAIDLMEYQVRDGRPTAEIGPRRSLQLGCGEAILDPFASGDAWGVATAAGPGGERRLLADPGWADLPCLDGAYDYVVALDGLEALSLVPLMHEVHRVLRPGGLFLSLARPLPAGDGGEGPFPGRFCEPRRGAMGQGFPGRFRLEQQRLQEDGRLLSLLRRCP